MILSREDLDLCEVHCIHEDVVKKVSSDMIPDERAQSLAEIFKTMGDSSRIKLIFALLQHEMCVCDLAAVSGLSDSSVSHHLRLLRNQNLVKFRREGKVVYYSLADQHVESLFRQGWDHINEP
ncbi:ArsR/SmtB family transcription factor [Syntrophomonas erecta]